MYTINFIFAVPGPVPTKSLKGTPFEDKIFLNWKEPMDPNGIITQYEVVITFIYSFIFIDHISTLPSHLNDSEHLQQI